jgi:hypothetical protein
MSNPRENLPVQPAPGGEAKPTWLQIVQNHVASLRYGSVVLTIHDSRVVQLEKQEKVRLDHAPH